MCVSNTYFPASRKRVMLLLLLLLHCWKRIDGERTSSLSLGVRNQAVSWDGNEDACWCLCLFCGGYIGRWWLVWLMGYGLSLIGHEIERREGGVCGFGD